MTNWWDFSGMQVVKPVKLTVIHFVESTPWRTASLTYRWPIRMILTAEKLWEGCSDGVNWRMCSRAPWSPDSMAERPHGETGHVKISARWTHVTHQGTIVWYSLQNYGYLYLHKMASLYIYIFTLLQYHTISSLYIFIYLYHMPCVWHCQSFQLDRGSTSSAVPKDWAVQHGSAVTRNCEVDPSRKSSIV